MVFTPEEFIQKVRNYDIFCTLVYFLEDKYKLLEYPNLPRFSLKYPAFRQVVTGAFKALSLLTILEEVGFTVGKAKNLWKQKKELALKNVEMAIRCYSLAIQLVEHGRIVDWYEGPGEIKNVFNSWDEFCDSQCQGQLVNVGKKFTALVYRPRDKFLEKIKGVSQLFFTNSCFVELESTGSVGSLPTRLLSALSNEEQEELLRCMGIERTYHPQFPNLLHLNTVMKV